jgi:hypothetical protein
MVDILKDHVPFPLWIPFFSGTHLGFVDVNNDSKMRKWPTRTHTSVRKSKAMHRETEGVVTSSRGRDAKRIKYNETSMSDGEAEENEDAEAGVDDYDDEDSEKSGEDEVVKRSHRRFSAKGLTEKQLSDLIDSRQKGIRGRIPLALKVHLKETIDQLNKLDGIADNNSFERLLENAGKHRMGLILVNVVPILEDTDGGEYFIPTQTFKM